jgi:hypothetical protein
VVWAATDANGSLPLQEVFSGEREYAGRVPLADALAAAGPRGSRAAVYLADGSLRRVPVAACALTSAGTLLLDGDDAGRVTGIVVDPPAATITDVARLAQRELACGGRALIIYLDGFGYDQFTAAGEAGVIPRMSGLKARKALTVFPTITPVTFAAMVSGEDPSVTGVHDRSTHSLDCASLFDWAEERGLATALIEGDVQILALTRDVVLNVDLDGDGLTDDEVMQAAAEALRAGRPDLMLVHLHGIDDTAHATGPHSAATRRVVAEQDRMVGELLERWSGRVIVVADHGQHAVEDPGTGQAKGEHGCFRSEDLFIPVLTRDPE